jgi:hypothetical protein
MPVMLRLVALALAVFAAFPVVAQTRVTPPPGLEDTAPPPPPGGMSVAKDGRIVMSSSVCPLLGEEPGVPGADYTPGIDVNGKSVAPADLPNSAPRLNLDDFPIEINVDLQKRYGVRTNSGLFYDKSMTGLVTVKDDRAYFNGKPLSDSERDMMRAACKAAKN